MILTLIAGIMYWNLLQLGDETDGSSTADASPPPSICGEDECSSLAGDFSNFSIDDAASDTTVSSQVDFESLWIFKFMVCFILLCDTYKCGNVTGCASRQSKISPSGFFCKLQFLLVMLVNKQNEWIPGGKKL